MRVKQGVKGERSSARTAPSGDFFPHPSPFFHPLLSPPEIGRKALLIKEKNISLSYFTPAPVRDENRAYTREGVKEGKEGFSHRAHPRPSNARFFAPHRARRVQGATGRVGAPTYQHLDGTQRGANVRAVWPKAESREGAAFWSTTVRYSRKTCAATRAGTSSR